MSRSLRLALAAAVSVAPVALHAQTANPDSLAFPRQFVKWALTSGGDSVLAHAAPALRASMQSAEAVNGMALRIQSRFGEMQGTAAEVQFDEGPLKVYIVAMRYAQAPGPAAWVVAYSPTTKVVERASFSSLASVKSNYPQATLP